MKNIQQIVVYIVSGLITFFVLREILRLVLSDYWYSVIPGWHTTLLDQRTTLSVTTLTLLICAAVIYLISGRQL